MRKISALLVSLALAACAHAPTPAEDAMKAGLMDGAIKTAHAPLFKLTCPAAGCVIGSMEVGNPQGASQMADALRVMMTPQTSASEKIALAIVDKGFGALGVGLVANGIKGFANAMFSSQTQIATTGFGALQNTANSGFSALQNTSLAGFRAIPQPAANITNNTTNTVGGSGVIGNGTFTTTDRHDVTTSTTTTNTNTNSNNTNPSPRVCTPTYNTTGAPTGFVCTGG